MEELALIAVGELPQGLLSHLSSFLSRSAVPCRASDRVVDPAPSYVASRAQHDSRRILPELEKAALEEGARVLGITQVDLYSAVFTFVFGEAQLGGKAAIVSVHRLQPTVYGLPADPARFLARVRKEALHETGHLLGLVHCRNSLCVMRFSAVAEEIDLKEDEFCPDCRREAERRRVPAP